MNDDTATCPRCRDEVPADALIVTYVRTRRGPAERLWCLDCIEEYEDAVEAALDA